MRSLLVLCASLGLCVATSWGTYARAQQQQQTQQPVFRSTTRLIVQTVTVKDKEGKVIEGLTAKDFSVTEDGHENLSAAMPRSSADVEAWIREVQSR